jgi:GMP synthase (glutamine-hydrolysing)
LGTLGVVTAPRLLFVQHEQDCPPGWFGDWVQEAGVDYDVVYGDRGEQIPATLDGYAGLIVLGGDMGANDDADHPWLTPTKSLIAAVVRAEQCFLGICLGHQLAAVAMGGEVIRNPQGQSTGLTCVTLTAAGRDDPLLSCVPDAARAVQWNNDIVSGLPQGSELLATAPDGSAQAIRYGERAWGVQFHPEVSAALFAGWKVDRDSADAPPGSELTGISAAIAAAEPELRRAWTPLAVRFAQLASQPQLVS